MFTRSSKIAAIAIAAGGMLALGVPAAMAGTPTPEPTITSNFGGVPRDCDVQVREVQPLVTPTDHVRPTPTPTVSHRQRCRPEHFNIALAFAGPNLGTTLANYAAATGPVSGVGSDDLSVSTNTFDRLSLPGGRVNLQHSGIPFPIVNLTNCTVGVLQHGFWRFNGGTGVNFRAIGVGDFRLALLAHFPNIRNQCSLRFLGSSNPLLQHRVSPDFLTVTVHGDGVASR